MRGHNTMVLRNEKSLVSHRREENFSSSVNAKETFSSPWFAFFFPYAEHISSVFN